MANNPLPPAIRDALLDKLTSDDAFRAKFQANPRDALSSLGLTQDLDAHADEATTCLSRTQGLLPNKELIAKARKQVSESDSVAPHTYAYFNG